MLSKFYLFLQFIVILFLITSCSNPVYYQLFKTESSGIEKKEAVATSSNDDIEITYQLWSEYGSSGFTIKNKTNEHIFIDMYLSHLIVNNVAHTYYQGRTTGSSRTVGTNLNLIRSSSWLQAQKGYNKVNAASSSTSASQNQTIENKASISYVELRVISIPPNSIKTITQGKNLTAGSYSHCDLKESPSQKEPSVMKFDESTTPLHIRNYISYKVGENATEYKKMEDIFWVSEISNYSQRQFITNKKVEYCDGGPSSTTVPTFKYYDPSSFYIKYSTTSSILLY